MKRLSILLLAFVAFINSINAQGHLGKINITPYIPEKANLGAQAEKLLTNKLNQVVTKGGATGGFDNRFIITASVNILSESETATIPQKTSLRASFTFYVGDGLSGTLFNSCNMEVVGVGDTREGALFSAIRKINANNKDLQALVAEGKERIVAYYNTNAPALIKEAEGLMAAREYQSALSKLGAIPSACDYYDSAQTLLAECGQTIIANENEALLIQAESAWSASPDANGAQEASKYLSQILPTSAAMQTRVNNLNNKINKRLIEIDNKDRALEMAAIAAEEKVRLAEINAAERVLTSYYKSRTVVYYDVILWY